MGEPKFSWKAVAITACITFYVCTGALFGYVFHSIPAASWPGTLYVAVTWPGWIRGVPNPPLPNWAFDFNQKRARIPPTRSAEQ